MMLRYIKLIDFVFPIALFAYVLFFISPEMALTQAGCVCVYLLWRNECRHRELLSEALKIYIMLEKKNK